MNEILNQQRMTSIEIAEVTGKQHKNVMQAIRNMEPAWVKLCGLKFQLTSRIIKQPHGGTREIPCYSLTKTECLYVATKFNDEARAKLVLRWEELETERLKRSTQPMSDMEILSRAVLICDKKIKELEHTVSVLEPKAIYCDDVLDSVDCMTTTQIAKELDMTVHDLTQQLISRGVMYWQSGQYMLYADYARRGYAKSRCHSYRDSHDELHTRNYLVWTERGRRFIHNLLRQKYLTLELEVQ